MAQTQFGIEIDGQRVTLVEVLDEVAVSVRTVTLDNLTDAVNLVLAGVKDNKLEAPVRAVLAIGKTAMRRIDVTSALRNRAAFEEAVYAKVTVSKENTTAAGIFFAPELMEGDTVSPGVAVVAPSDPVNEAYRAFGRRDVEIVAPPLAYRGFDGLWLSIRYETAELTLVRENRAVAYRQMQSGGLSSIVGLLADPSEPTIGYARLESALTKSGLEDPMAEAELDRYLRKVLSECQSTIRFWKQAGDETNGDIFVFGAGATSSTLDSSIKEAGFNRVIPEYISKQIAFLPPADRDIAIGAWCAAITVGADMPQAAYINTSKIEYDEKLQKKNSLRNKLYFVGAAAALTLVFGGVPYLVGILGKSNVTDQYNQAVAKQAAAVKEITLYDELVIRNQVITSVKNAEPSWSIVLAKGLTYIPAGTTIQSIQATRTDTLLTIVVSAVTPGNAYSQISKWLDQIKTTGGASDAWISNFTVRDGKTTSQLTYSISLSKSKPVKENTNSEATTTATTESNSTAESTLPTDPAKGSVK
jgi:hypothetical protein